MKLDKESLSPKKRDSGFLGLPVRHWRTTLFVLLSILILALPLTILIFEYDGSAPLPLNDEETASIGHRLGKGKEIFNLIAEAATSMPPGYPGFDEAVTRIVYEARRLQRELKGLAYLTGDPPQTQAAADLASRIEKVSASVQNRVTLAHDLLLLRAILCQTATEDEPSLCASHLCANNGCSNGIQSTAELKSTRQLLLGAQAEATSERLVPLSLLGNACEAGRSSEESRRVATAEIYRHFAWKRSEILRIIETTLQLDARESSSASSNAQTLDKGVQACIAHALTLQRVASGLSKASVWVSLALACLAALFWYRMWIGRQYALGRGRWRAQLVVYVFVVLQVYNIVLVGAYQPEATLPEEEAITAKTAFLKEAYKTATQEIHHRLEQEQHFYILKFTMIGSLLAVFFRFLLSSDDEKREKQSPTDNVASRTTRPLHSWPSLRKYASPKDAIDKLRDSKIAAFFFWAAVIINCIVDTRLRYNGVICTALGRWIRTQEASIEEYGLTGWETFFDQQALISSSPLMQVAPTLLTTIVFVLTVVLFLAKEQANVSVRGNVRDNLHQVNLVFGGIAFLVMAFSALGQPGMPWEWSGPVLTWVLAGVVVLYLGPKGIQGRVFRRDEITDSLVGYAFPFHYFDFHNTLRLPFISPRTTSSVFAQVLNGSWQWLKWIVCAPLIRVCSYAPVPGVRRALVKLVNKSLQLQFLHLELNNDPPLVDVLAGSSDLRHTGPHPLLWSLLYMRAGPPGRRRLKKGLGLSLADDTESAKLVMRWLEGHTDYIRRLPTNPDVFEIRSPSKLASAYSGVNSYLECEDVRYCRVHDYYDEFNPWLLFVCELRSTSSESPGENTTKDLIIFSAKDTDSHQMGVAAQWFGGDGTSV